jgi:hypothetical protein
MILMYGTNEQKAAEVRGAIKRWDVQPDMQGPQRTNQGCRNWGTMGGGQKGLEAAFEAELGRKR